MTTDRVAYLLTTDKNSERTLFSQQVLKQIGFNVILVQHIPHTNQVISNKISMCYIYELIHTSLDEYAYVFEDDINILENISLSEIIQYETISNMFFYLGICECGGESTIKDTLHVINYHKIFSISGNVRGLHAIGLSKKGAKELLDFANCSDYIYMDMILEDFSKIYPANVVRYDIESDIDGHRGVIFQDRRRFPSTIYVSSAIG
jgi:hypothetical protein